MPIYIYHLHDPFFADDKEGPLSFFFLSLFFADDEEDPLSSGAALFCFISDDKFVGLVELDSDATLLRLHGSETSHECSKEFCGVNDCCGETAFTVSVQVNVSHSKSTHLSHSQLAS